MSQYSAAPTHDRYRDARVLTASQPELQRMLLDGAARFGRQAHQQLSTDGPAGEFDRLMKRTLDIAAELTHSVAGSQIEAARRLEEDYAFLFRQLAAAHINRDGAALEAALGLIEFHRETWKLACEKLQSGGAPAAPPMATPAPHAAFDGAAEAAPRLSLEA